MLLFSTICKCVSSGVHDPTVPRKVDGSITTAVS